MRKESVKKGKSKAGKIISIIEYVVIFLIIFLNIILVYKTIHNPNKTPDLFGKKAFIIISGSEWQFTTSIKGKRYFPLTSYLPTFK